MTRHAACTSVTPLVRIVGRLLRRSVTATPETAPRDGCSTTSVTPLVTDVRRSAHTHRDTENPSLPAVMHAEPVTHGSTVTDHDTTRNDLRDGCGSTRPSDPSRARTYARAWTDLRDTRHIRHTTLTGGDIHHPSTAVMQGTLAALGHGRQR